MIATADGGLIVVDTTDESILPTGVCEIVQPGPASIGSPDSDTESKRMVSPQSATTLGGEDVFALWFDDGLNRVRGEHFGTTDDEYWVRAGATANDLVLAIETYGAVTGTNLGSGTSADIALVVIDLDTYAVSVESQFGGPWEDSVTSVEIVGDVVWVAGDSDSSPSVFGTTEWPLRSDVNATVTSRAMWLTA